MATLVRYQGKLLRSGAALARGVSCCCGDVDCPNCCITIDWGVFNGDGDLEQVFTSLKVTLVMPTKNSRAVCDNQQVTVKVTIDFASFEVEGESPPVFIAEDFSPFVRWDRSWDYVSHEPPVSVSCGIVIEDGLVEWCTMTADAGQPFGFFATYQVTLAYNKCWNHTSIGGVQYGDIEAGDRSPGDSALITGTFCESTECCEVVVDCDPCCFYLDPTSNHIGYELDDQGNPVFWSENNIGDRIKVTVVGLETGKLTYCTGDLNATGTLRIEMDLIPAKYSQSSPWYPQASINGQSWTRVSHNPSVGLGTVVDGPDPGLDVSWGSDISSLSYDVTMQTECPYEPGLITANFEYNSNGAQDSATVLLEWIRCGSESDFCCCPCPPCIFDLLQMVTGTVWFYDDGEIFITFTQDPTADTIAITDCSVTVLGSWNVVVDGVSTVTSGSITVSFDGGTFTFDGGTQSGIVFLLEVAGPCNGGLSFESATFNLVTTVTGAECYPEGEP